MPLITVWKPRIRRVNHYGAIQSGRWLSPPVLPRAPMIALPVPSNAAATASRPAAITIPTAVWNGARRLIALPARPAPRAFALPRAPMIALPVPSNAAATASRPAAITIPTAVWNGLCQPLAPPARFVPRVLVPPPVVPENVPNPAPSNAAATASRPAAITIPTAVWNGARRLIALPARPAPRAFALPRAPMIALPVPSNAAATASRPAAITIPTAVWNGLCQPLAPPARFVPRVLVPPPVVPENVPNPAPSNAAATASRPAAITIPTAVWNGLCQPLAPPARFVPRVLVPPPVVPENVPNPAPIAAIMISIALIRFVPTAFVQIWIIYNRRSM